MQRNSSRIRCDLIYLVCRTYVGREFVLRLNEWIGWSLSLDRIIILLEFWLLLFDEDAVVNKITTSSH